MASKVGSSDVYDEIRKNPKISANQLAEKIGITSRAVEMQIATLKQAGKIVRIGFKRGGHWEIK